VGGRDGLRVESAQVKVGRRLRAWVFEAPVSQVIRRPRLAPGRAYLLRVRAELRDGRVFTLDRRLRGC
jgi:hypothetical protein